MLRPLLMTLAISTAAGVAVAAEPATRPAEGDVIRVYGDVAAPEAVEAKAKDGSTETHWHAGDAKVLTPLPESYPPPTPPGAIELKTYPVVRQAIVDGEGSGRGAFWPLFMHITRRDIAMTAPVVMTGRSVGDDEKDDSMAFLYRSIDLGPVGDAENDVVVEDTEPGVFLSIGLQGRRGDNPVEEARAELQAWLAGQEGDVVWQATDGPVRLLGYNGPDRPQNLQWWEVQIPVERVETSG